MRDRDGNEWVTLEDDGAPVYLRRPDIIAAKSRVTADRPGSWVHMRGGSAFPVDGSVEEVLAKLGVSDQPPPPPPSNPARRARFP